MINEDILCAYSIDDGVIDEDLNNKNCLVEKILKDPKNIPYIFKSESEFKIKNLKPHSNFNYELMVSNFYFGLLNLKKEINETGASVNSRTIIDPCGFGYRPIGDPPHESSRVFLAVALKSKHKELGMKFTLIRGGCYDKPTYKVSVFDRSHDILDNMEQYIQIGGAKEPFIPFRLEK